MQQKAILISIVMGIAALLVAVPAFARDAVPAFAQDAVPAFAQESYSRTFTETQINDSFRVNNPIRARISNVSVDLQPSQVQISATHTSRRSTTDTVTTMIPSIENGRVYWTVTAITTGDGEPTSEELIEQVNNRIASSWRNYIRGQVDGTLESVTITETDITFTGTFDGDRARALDDAVESGDITAEENPRAFRLNEFFNRLFGRE